MVGAHLRRPGLTNPARTVSGPHPAVAAIRVAVRSALADMPNAPVGVAFSGGPDSTALLAATCFVHGGPVSAVIVDQHWYDGSAVAASAAADRATRLGAAAAVVQGPAARTEAAARAARYGALDAAVADLGLAVMLLGHTRDDQAETVLLGLGRGSGARSLAGMAPIRGSYRRPLLDVAREVTLAACAAEGHAVYDDPANQDSAFVRTRLRRDALGTLRVAFGHDVRANLARTARLLRDDADLLDDLATAAAADVAVADSGELSVELLSELPPALRRRVLHRWAAGAGGAPNAAHIDALDALVVAWRGQGAVSLPGGIRVGRTSGRIGRVTAAPSDPLVASSDPSAAVLPPGAALRPPAEMPPGIVRVLITEDQIRERIAELAAEIDIAHAGHDIVLVAVLKGAFMVVADLSRALKTTASLEFMAVSSYGAATSSSGVVRILKDLDRDIAGKHVVVVEDIIDSGLTLSWLVRNLQARHPASLDICALLRKPEAIKVSVKVRWVGFDLGPEFVVGYGLDYAERYRGLPYVGLLDPDAVG
jgi:tRNA(Ile)-lysidine synthase